MRFLLFLLLSETPRKYLVGNLQPIMIRRSSEVEEIVLGAQNYRCPKGKKEEKIGPLASRQSQE